jgi:hypothetical protein
LQGPLAAQITGGFDDVLFRRQQRGTYGIELNEDGSLLVIVLNGTFGPELHRGIAPLSMTHPSIAAVHIPASEQVE